MGNSHASVPFTQVEPKDLSHAPKTTRGYSFVSNHVNNSVLIFGGIPASAKQASVFELSLENFYWHELKCSGVTPASRFHHSSIVFHEQMLVFGGEDQYGNKLNDLQSFNLETYEWKEVSTTGTGPSVRSGHSAVLHKNKMIIFGGERGNSFFNDGYILDLTTFSWTDVQFKGAIPSPRAYHAAASYGNEMIVFGGRNGENFYNDCYILHTDTLIWEKVKYKSAHGVPSKRAHACALILSGSLIIFGGLNFDHVMNDLYIMKLSGRDFIQLSLVSTSSLGEKDPSFIATLKSVFFRAVEFNGKIILLGGHLNGVQTISDCYEGDLAEFQKIMDVPFSELQFGNKIATGVFREVYNGVWRGEPVAIKLMKKNVVAETTPSTPQSGQNLSKTPSFSNSFTENSKSKAKEVPQEEDPLAKYIAELNILRQLKHPNVLGFKCMASTEDAVAVVTELLDMNLGFALFDEDKETKKKSITLTWDQKITILLDVIRGIHFLHHKGLVHANLTPSTVLISNNYRAKLSDFFLSANNLLNKSSTTFTDRIKLQRSPYYLAPELLNDKQPENPVDVYSFGILMWEVFTRQRAFGGSKDHMTIALQIKNENRRPVGDVEMKELMASEVDLKYLNGAMDESKKQYLTLMQKCWSLDPDDRPSTDNIIRILKLCSGKGTGGMSSITTNAMENEMKSMRYEKLKLLGRGGQAQVFLVRDRNTQALYAQKKFFSCKISELNEVLIEMRTAVSLKHQCLVQVKDFFLSDIDQDMNCCFNLITEYMDGGDLSNAIKSKKSQKSAFDEKFLFQVLFQLFSGVKYVHSFKIVHRDLKPQNIFLMKNSNNVKIADFGLARQVSDEKAMETFCGTIQYMSPEQRNQKKYDLTVDIWALGVILFELMTLHNFDYNLYLSQKRHYLNTQFHGLGFRQFFADLVFNCLQPEPHKRLDMDTALKYLKSNANNHELDEFIANADQMQPPLQEAPLSSVPLTPLEIPTKPFDSQPATPVAVEKTPTSPIATKPKASKSVQKTDSFTQQNNSKTATIPTPVSTTESTISTTPYVSKKFFELQHELKFANAIQWDVEQACTWMDKVMHMPQYVHCLRSHDIHGEALIELNTIEDFQVLGVTKLGHIKLLQKYIRLLRSAFADPLV